MVKSKKTAKKTEDTVMENDAPAENSVDPADEVNEKPSQENGEVASAKKKGKGKQAKKEDEDKEEAAIKENGSGDAKEKKKTPAKRAAKTQSAEPERKSSRTPKPVKTTNDEGESYEVEKLIIFS